MRVIRKIDASLSGALKLILMIIGLWGVVTGAELNFDDVNAGVIDGDRYESQGVIFRTVSIPDEAPFSGQTITPNSINDQIRIVGINGVSRPNVLVNGTNSVDDILCVFASPITEISCNLDGFRGAGERGDIVRMIALRELEDGFLVVGFDEEEDGGEGLGYENDQTFTHVILQCTTEREGFDDLSFEFESCPVFSTTVGFDQADYSILPGERVEGTLIINPVPIGGLYSHGFQMLVRDESGVMAGFVRPTPNPVLGFDGLISAGLARQVEEQGAGALKGSADFFDRSLPVITSAEIASFSIESLPVGNYELTLDFWNELGPTEDIFVTGCCEVLDDVMTFGTAQIVVASPLPEIDGLSALQVEAQTGLIQQELTLTNNGANPVSGFRVYIEGLPDDVTVYNAHGYENGVPYIEIHGEIAPGESITVTLEFRRVSRITDFTPEYRLETGVDEAGEPDPDAKIEADLRILEITGKGVLVEFATEAGKTYLIEYSEDMSEWHVSPTPVQGTGQRVQWLDAGPPKTLAYPSTSRFYRLTEKP